MPELLQSWVTSRAETSPDSTAVVEGLVRSSYGDLESQSNALAHVLAGVGLRPGDRVALLLPKSIRAVVAMHGVLKAGGVYVPVDTKSPAPRAAKIIASAAPTVLLADRRVAGLIGELREILPSMSTMCIGWLDDAGTVPGDAAFTLGDVDLAPTAHFGPRRDSHELAHILFTSGSTGAPKGVSITHANVCAFVGWAVPYFGITSSDRNSGHHPLHFDLSTFDMYGAFAAGAELHLVPPPLNLFAVKLAAFIRDNELTQWFSVPSLLSYMAQFDVVEPEDFPSLKRVMWCGEVLPTKSLMYWMEKLPHVEFTNLYGPTEATIASSYHRVPRRPETENEPVPIGIACGGESLHVLGDALEPSAPGEIGNLYIGGVGLSPGYWQDEAKTNAAFKAVELPEGRKRLYRTGDLAKADADGTAHYVGREDTQIKSRGYRIELGEIEAALNGLECIGECAVVALESSGFEGKAIGCAYSFRPGYDRSPGQLRKELSRVIPRYMLPVRWLGLDALPKNPNGKIDRPALVRRLGSEHHPDSTMTQSNR